MAAVLEVSSPNINGGAFTDITDPAVGGNFVTGGYVGVISNCCGSVASRPNGLEWEIRAVTLTRSRQPRTERSRANDQAALPHGLG